MAPADNRVVSLPAVVDLDAVEALREGLMDALDQGPVTVSGAAVERMSTNGLFLLLSAAATARRNDCRFAIADASEAMLGALERLGLTPHFAGVLEG